MKKPAITCLLISPAILLAAAPVQATGASLQFDPMRYQARVMQVEGQTLAYRAYENIAYVQKALDPSVQVMNIYIPETYFQGETVGPYNAETAPIFMPNFVGGYMPSRPGVLYNNEDPKTDLRTYSMAKALSKGYVVASPGVRGRTSRHPSGIYIGKAPAAIIDLKAAVRYLRYNDSSMPGSASHIIANGTSAGGALSALLGATGNNPDYRKALKTLGAAPAPDNIFAVSSYCPITNLEHADTAYEWQFGAVPDYKKIDITQLDYKTQRQEVAGTLSKEQLQTSATLSNAFPGYLNSLRLKNKQGQRLELDEFGQGSFRAHLKQLLIASAQTALNQGKNPQAHPWVTVQGNIVTDIDLNLYIVKYLGRMKPPPAFDGLNLENGENQLFGAKRIDKRHFTRFSARNQQRSTQLADAFTIGLMNPMTYIGAPNTDMAPNWRIRMGTKDKDTSLAIPAMLALALENQGLNPDFQLAWEQPHGGDYDLEELFAWIDKIIAP